jgi:hypothetical protein
MDSSSFMCGFGKKTPSLNQQLSSNRSGKKAASPRGEAAWLGVTAPYCFVVKLLTALSVESTPSEATTFQK